MLCDVFWNIDNLDNFHLSLNAVKTGFKSILSALHKDTFKGTDYWLGYWKRQLICTHKTSRDLSGGQLSGR